MTNGYLKIAIFIFSSLPLTVQLSCTSSDEPSLISCEDSDLTISFVSVDPVSCSSKDGLITPAATGGEAPYQFAIDSESFGTLSSFPGLGAGIYTIKVKDKNGCERATRVRLNATGSTLAATVEVTDSGCKTNNGVIIINATGGVAPFSYVLNGSIGLTNNAFLNLSTGAYSVMVIDSEGCSVTQSVNVYSGVKYSTEIKKIMDTYCTLSGCHIDGGNISFKVLANIQASAKDVKARTQSGNMPKNGVKLEQSEIDAIACWVDDGALDN